MIPGAFPTDDEQDGPGNGNSYTNGYGSRNSTDQDGMDISNPSFSDFNPRQSGGAMDIVDQENLDDFKNHQKVSLKTQRQLTLISQLDTLVYILVGYQLIKYCHSACLLPVIGHIFVQKSLCCERFTPYNNGREFRDFLSFINELESTNDHESRINHISNRVCAGIYWKCFITIIYHFGFIAIWLIPIANNGQLDLLTNGTWWFISFIGESIQVDNFGDLNYLEKLILLGLMGLIISDLFILFIQLLLYQAIYRQSNVSPIGRRLVGKEIEILRTGASGNSGNGSELVEITYEPPMALVVKLFETFKTSTFIARGNE